MNTITITLNKKERDQLKETWIDGLVDKNLPYTEYQLRLENCVITAYTSGKVVFQGKDAEVYAAYLLKNRTNKTHAGSDEVGTGDYFGPVCVCACIVKDEDEDWIKQLGIKDSKQLTDLQMLKIAPLLMNQLDYSLLILNNARYNCVHEKNNLNAIKAKLHNQAYLNLINKGHQLPSMIVVDQFTPEPSYYRYLKNEKHVVKGIHFETKAENKYLAVACASIIARYGFLKAWESLESHYKMTFTKGAGSKVDENAISFVKQYGWDELKNIAKLHFKNTENIKKIIE